MAKGIQSGMAPISMIRREEPAGIGMAETPPSKLVEEKPKDRAKDFGDFAGTDDTKEIAKFLMNKGLKGADQLYTDHPDISTPNGIKNAQSDWKPAAISKMLLQAKALGIKSPEGVMANKAALMGGLDDRIKQALNHKVFNEIHPNFWQVFGDLLKDQYAKQK